ncbi:MAG TPA: Uma2 family endonuclease [Bryobacteraceae bacterium]|nr:Uma2 family endonuclease [Bryobacteraceae bacterium]
MAAATGRMTVEDFRKLPQDQGPVYHELRHGEVVAVTRPKLKQSLIQRALRSPLELVAESGSLVDVELAFRPLPEHELWVADVAYLSAERFRQADPEDNIRGAPDLVVEVLSPSNTAAEIYEKEELCLENGSREFWVVDPDRRQVKVSTPDGHTQTWRSGQEIPLPLFGSEARVKVDDIFRY